MQTKKITLGQKIKRYRLVNDIRQEDMAEKMGISRATLINYEKGHTAINLDVLNRLKEIYPDFKDRDDLSLKPKIISNNIIDFKVLFRVIADGKYFIIISTLLFGLIGLGFSFVIKKSYDAEISLYPAKNDINQGYGQFQSIVANLGMNTANNDQKFNIPDVVMSRRIAAKVVTQKWISKDGKSIDLIHLWGINKKSRINFIKGASNDSLSMHEKAIKRFNDHIKVNEDRLTGLINISTSFEDPNIASSIANFIGKQVEDYIQKENSAQSKKEKLFINDRLLIVKKELEKTELELKNFKERNRGYEESPELFMLYSQLFREVEAKKEVYLTLQQQLELARIEEVKRSPILHILDYAVTPISKSFPNRFAFLFISAFFGMALSSFRVIYNY